ncbi:LysR substrate-binding domain-containing protein [Parasphingorhabdus sp.]|uniref:LysR substrate-binding domain-containing protein n=1 Tax=Parasphingorhabdus sp. TaxID=2709688 RepID=UPI0032F06833
MDVTQFNLRHLNAALQIFDRGSISAAAQAVNLTQPAITQGLAKLETQLAIMLFERTSAGMQATEAMDLLAPRITAALESIGSSRVTMAQMRAFLAVAEYGSYPLASASTGLAPPTLHRAVNDLGLALKRSLFERRGKGLSLTVYGRRLVRSLRLARTELIAALSEISALKGSEVGEISIGAMPLSRARFLPHIVGQFYREHPEIRIKIVEGSHAELIEPLRDGEVDFLIGALRDPGPGDDVQQKALFEDQPVVIARAGHPLTVDQSSGGPAIKDLSQYPWIIAAPGTPLRGQWQDMFRHGGLEPPVIPIECGSVITIRQILMESDFLTLLSPDQVAVELEANWLVTIGEGPQGLKRTIGISTRTGWRPTMLQLQFIDMMHQYATGMNS